ncbi:hypothetical protein Glove_169g39 [Diversispora epigaea]|uniref:Uncharacterized protein n=1 Tax=Diversispora epigaea TaxID=1348612 RepID=A0A397IPF7_9GLOM|nr:hypothetical protein Glove_169g39 [Diversispora epigaea]
MFYHKCLFCEASISVNNIERKTILSLCEFCLKRYEVIEELKKNEEANNDQINEVYNCFYESDTKQVNPLIFNNEIKTYFKRYSKPLYLKMSTL